MLRRLVNRGAALATLPYVTFEPLSVTPLSRNSLRDPCAAQQTTPLCLTPLLKTFASVPDRQQPATADQRSEGADIMRSLNAYAFREHLEELSNTKMHISFDEMVTLALEQGASTTKEESRALCEALVTAGAVFRFRNVVYLRTDDVAEIILSSLPDTETEFKKRVEMIQRELRPLEVEKEYIDKHASQISTRFLWVGFAVVVLQFGVFLRLTFWELSWDFMEPVAYFVSLANGIAIYLYFLLSHQNFEIHHLRDNIKSYFTQKNATHFDKRRYEELTRELVRYQKYLARFGR